MSPVLGPLLSAALLPALSAVQRFHQVWVEWEMFPGVACTRMCGASLSEGTPHVPTPRWPSPGSKVVFKNQNRPLHPSLTQSTPKFAPHVHL